MRRKNSITPKAAKSKPNRVKSSSNLSLVTRHSSVNRRVAFLWDESFLWSIMAVKALQKAGLQFDIVRSKEIRSGCLKNFAMLFVPGGWSSNKIKALGDRGVRAVKRFVHNGGNYIGFCGGAGLATLDGIGLLDIRRRPTRERVPSFSGRIRLSTAEHPVWHGISEPVFHAWWPPQFAVPHEGIKVLASYGKALPDAFSSDLNVGDVLSGRGWEELEQRYGINLDPARIMNDAAVIEGSYGKGTVILSLVHFDTPDDADGGQVLKNLWRRYAFAEAAPAPPRGAGTTAAAPCPAGPCFDLMHTCETAVAGLIDLGIRNFLWFWRNPMLLQWRRGVRGLEYCTLFVMVREAAERLSYHPLGDEPKMARKLRKMSRKLLSFTDRAQDLLVRERIAMQGGHITYERCDDRDIQRLREELFSSSKSYGGLFKTVIDEIDDLLYLLLAGNKMS